ncbi:MAG: hypothetical protein M3545_04150 [Acidobacteriota bacterium]|nr:hypothetical protein [Acidobacteriota bacterium]
MESLTIRARRDQWHRQAQPLDVRELRAPDLATAALRIFQGAGTELELELRRRVNRPLARGAARKVLG